MERRIPELIDRIYDAAVEPDLWPGVMRELASALDSATASVLLHDLEANAFRYVALHPDHPVEAVAEYEQRHAERDPLRINAERLGELTLHTESELAPAADLRRLDVYNDFYVKWGWGRGLGGCIFRNDEEAAILMFQRASDDQPYSPREVETAGRLAPHIARAIEVNRRLWRAAAAREISQAAMEGVDAGVIVLDGRARIVFANQRARQIADARDGLVIEKEALLAQRSDDAVALQCVVGSALSAGPGRSSSSCAIRRRSGPPVWLIVSPFGPSGQGGALVIINDPDEDLSRLAARLAQRHRLTAAEGRVAAALCRGHSPSEIAEMAHISVHTVRSHLKNIQARLGVSGQTQIVAELLRGPGFVARGSLG